MIVELISWIDCTLVDKLNKLKTKDDEITEDFDERLRIAQTLRDMGNVRQKKMILFHKIYFLIFRMNMLNIILNVLFVIMLKANNFY